MVALAINTNTKELEEGVSNKWRWQWLNEIGEDGEPYGSWLEKPAIPGVAKCFRCQKQINYGKNGKKIFKQHARDSDHKTCMGIKRTNQVSGFI